MKFSRYGCCDGPWFWWVSLSSRFPVAKRRKIVLWYNNSSSIHSTLQTEFSLKTDCAIVKFYQLDIIEEICWIFLLAWDEWNLWYSMMEFYSIRKYLPFSISTYFFSEDGWECEVQWSSGLFDINGLGDFHQLWSCLVSGHGVQTINVSEDGALEKVN